MTYAQLRSKLYNLSMFESHEIIAIVHTCGKAKMRYAIESCALLAISLSASDKQEMLEA